jgi:protein phosphatase PTC7
METCKRLIEQDKLNLNDGNINRSTPIKILSNSYNALLENKNGLIGSSTACVIVFHRESHSVHAANLGDSGFIIIRNNKIVHRSLEQQHYFNSPFQLAIHPSLNNNNSNSNEDSLISDLYVFCLGWVFIVFKTFLFCFFRPESASTSTFEVVEGDFIIIATDGLWDNLPESSLLTEISKIKVSLV